MPGQRTGAISRSHCAPSWCSARSIRMQASERAAPVAEQAHGRACRIVLVGKGPPDRGGISAFLGDLLKSDLGARHDLRLLNLYREGDRAGGRLTGANVTRTLDDPGRVWRAPPHPHLVPIPTPLLPLMPRLPPRF